MVVWRKQIVKQGSGSIHKIQRRVVDERIKRKINDDINEKKRVRE